MDFFGNAACKQAIARRGGLSLGKPMQTLGVAILVVVILLALARPSLAEIDPRCGNLDVYTDAVQTSTSEMHIYVQATDMSSARLAYENGLHMALTAYNLHNACGGYNAALIDSGFEQLLEMAYDDRVIDAREASYWIHALLVSAYAHGDTKDQIERWTALAKELAAISGGAPKKVPVIK